MKRILGSLLIAAFVLQATPAFAQTDLTSSTDQFITSYMQNPNGTLATYLKDSPSSNPNYVAGRESLSESLGLRMSYLFKKGDRARFQVQADLLKQYYLSPASGLVYWKLNKDGSSNVTTNALIDDWRIAGALFQAGEAWGNSAYVENAKGISRALAAKNMKNGYFVDFYDETYNINNDTLSLFYVDPVVLKYMQKYGIITKKTYTRTIGVLNNAANDGVFFAKNFNVNTGTYRYDADVHMIEQIYTAYFRKQNGINSPGFYQFVKGEFAKNGRLYGQYSRNTRQPAVNFESNAVYGMMIQYALEMNDPAFAKAVYGRMKQYEITDQTSPYYGGYVVETGQGQDTHIFDNLFPLLAKQQLERYY